MQHAMPIATDVCRCFGCTNTPRERVLIAIGGRAGSGKSTAAEHLVRAHGFKRMKFADPLKNMLRVLGLTDAEIEGDRKELPSDLLCGKTPRHAMQTLGTEWRDMLGRDLWTRAWRKAYDVSAAARVVIDDLRFPHEVEAVHAAGGVCVVLIRPAVDTALVTHVSEALAFEPDFRLANVGTREEIGKQLDALIHGPARRVPLPAS